MSHFPDRQRVKIPIVFTPMAPIPRPSAVRKCPGGSPWASAESSPNSPGLERSFWQRLKRRWRFSTIQDHWKMEDVEDENLRIWNTLWWTNSLQLKMAIEIVDFPLKKWWFSIAMLVHQRVCVMCIIFLEVSWKFGVPPLSLDGWFHGKSQSQMDDDWG